MNFICISYEYYMNFKCTSFELQLKLNEFKDMVYLVSENFDIWFLARLFGFNQLIWFLKKKIWFQSAYLVSEKKNLVSISFFGFYQLFWFLNIFTFGFSSFKSNFLVSTSTFWFQSAFFGFCKLYIWFLNFCFFGF